MSTPQRSPQVQVHRGRDRKRTETGWLDSRHSFSFGQHYDPANTHFGLLLVSNDDRVRAGNGFESHPHRDMEIVTWVLAGSLVHQDSEGHCGVIYPGLAQRMSAGTGIHHSERNDAWRLGARRHEEDVHFVQMWVPPDTDAVPPGYEQLDINRELGPVGAGSGELVVVASGMDAHRGRRAISIRQRHAALHAGRLPAEASTQLPEARFVHLFVARGSAVLDDAGTLEAGDTARLTASGGRRVGAGPEGSEILVWQMTAGLGDLGG